VVVHLPKNQDTVRRATEEFIRKVEEKRRWVEEQRGLSEKHF
jgi:hypothetical protein